VAVEVLLPKLGLTMETGLIEHRLARLFERESVHARPIALLFLDMKRRPDEGSAPAAETA
jgi:hypothetical protein